jgi:hypothetical protein
LFSNHFWARGELKTTEFEGEIPLCSNHSWARGDLKITEFEGEILLFSNQFWARGDLNITEFDGETPMVSNHFWARCELNQLCNTFPLGTKPPPQPLNLQSLPHGARLQISRMHAFTGVIAHVAGPKP